MSPIVETFDVPARGVGKPDYSRKVSSGKVRAGFSLQYGEVLKCFIVAFTNEVTPFPYILAPLAPGAVQPYIDADTGFDMSTYRIPQGYILQVLCLMCKTNQDVSMWVYFDTFCAGTLLQLTGGVSHYDNDVVPVSTELIDPTGASHLFEFRLRNDGGADLFGGATAYCILRPVGTAPPPKIKKVRCKWCGHEWEVPSETTIINCPKCSQLNIYYDTSRFRGL